MAGTRNPENVTVIHGLIVPGCRSVHHLEGPPWSGDQAQAAVGGDGLAVDIASLLTGQAGIAFGIYLPVDQALFIDVLPDKTAAGRDLGVAALASNLGQALGPFLAGQVVVLTGGYRGVWAVALVLTAVAALSILRVRNAR
ncbi:hypothetical protein ACQP2X_12235 [Actinoplanes sp. CA-131856]